MSPEIRARVPNSQTVVRTAHPGKRRVSAALACIVIVALAACAHAPRVDEPTPSSETLDVVVNEVIERYRLPGIAVGIIWNGEILYTRTHGEVIAGSGDRVDAATIFKIASNSKAMTTALLARLVDRGKLRWDDPVVRHLPAFRMSDPWVTREMQVRDLLIHNSGLRPGAGDLMLWPEPNFFTRADIIAALEHLKPVYSVRARYTYDNLLYVVAGEVAAAAGGASFEELLKREVFEPLGLERCQVGEWHRDRVGNVAQPHMLDGETNVPIRQDEPIIPAVTSAAAGGVRCSLADMLAWMRVWLDPELRTPSGERWLSLKRRDELWSAHITLPVPERQREWFNTWFSAYGLGWRLWDAHGELLVGHTGTLAGMYSALVLFPERRHGFVFMINGNGAEARTVLRAVLTKLIVAPQEVMPVAHYAQRLAQQRPARNVTAPDTSARESVAPEALRDVLGVYRDSWFGEVHICADGARVEFRSSKSPRLRGAVMRVGDQLLVDWYDASVSAEPWLTFERRGSAEVTLTMARVDPLGDSSYGFEDLFFTRVDSCELH